MLVEGVSDHGDGTLTGRMSNNLLVHFQGPKTLIGTLVPVALVDSKGFYFIGEWRGVV